MRKIDAPRAVAYWDDGEIVASTRQHSEDEHCYRVRIVRETDWRKLMTLLKAADTHRRGGLQYSSAGALLDALNALNKEPKKGGQK